SRSSVIADQTWGAGKGPTISLQKSYDSTDRRRKWTYMTNGDFYPNLAKAQGGYTYKYFNRDAEGTAIEERNEMNAHIKKYIIGKAADCNGNVGLGQDAANNIYLIRLADMYLTYAEAILGTSTSTSDAKALEKYNGIRKRAGVSEANSITFKDIMQERRREFAFESITWFDVLRLRYREGDAAALEYVNSGYGSGYNRVAQYLAVSGMDQSQENDDNSYIIVQNRDEYAMYDPIILTASAFVVPIPAAVSTSCPAFAGEPVDFYAGE
ncbi:MAG: RagB/SusD family nutrient uptake outer membrane protein, partial [Muribaculaceae bacterium]|nr:RagB/SusD family nutrient uptake outer membrane protein [Muribaculaceae bacterium]